MNSITGSQDLFLNPHHNETFTETPIPQQLMMAILFTFQAVIQFNTSFKLFRFI